MDHGRHATTAMIKNGYPRKWIVRQLRRLRGLVAGREPGSPPRGQILEKDDGAVGHPMSRGSPVGEQTAYPFDERKKWLRAAALAALPCQCVNERPTCTRQGAYRSQFSNCQASRFLQRGVSWKGGSRSRGGMSGLNSCARWRPVVQWCAECRRPVGEDPHYGPGCWQREQAQRTRSTPPDE